MQETLAKAYYAISMATEMPPLRPFLFRIAHNTAMDVLRRYERRHVELVAEPPEDLTVDERPDPGGRACGAGDLSRSADWRSGAP